VPYDEFARLRRQAPVAWFPDEGSGFWSVHRYANIVAADRDVATFSSGRGVSFEEPTDEDMAARRTIIDTDPPEHTKLRKIGSGTFSQRAVAVYEHFITELTEQVLDRCPASGPFDFVDAVAKEVPIRVLARVMGLPSADPDLFIDLGDRLIANTDPDITDVVWGRDDTDAYRRFPFRSPYGNQMWDLGRQVVHDRLAPLNGPEPGDDLLSWRASRGGSGRTSPTGSRPCRSGFRCEPAETAAHLDRELDDAAGAGRGRPGPVRRRGRADGDRRGDGRRAHRARRVGGRGRAAGSASAVDVGTLPFDPRVEVRRYDGS
jgi:cytochrome P450